MSSGGSRIRNRSREKISGPCRSAPKEYGSEARPGGGENHTAYSIIKQIETILLNRPAKRLLVLYRYVFS